MRIAMRVSQSLDIYSLWGHQLYSVSRLSFLLILNINVAEFGFRQDLFKISMQPLNFTFRIPKINTLFIASNNTMQKTLSFSHVIFLMVFPGEYVIWLNFEIFTSQSSLNAFTFTNFVNKILTLTDSTAK